MNSKLFFSLLFLSLGAGSAATWAQQARYPLPKYSPKFGMETKDFGPRPGSRVPQGGEKSPVFTRIYRTPAGLRLLVRANCGTRIGRAELIERAEKSTLPSGPIVQIDWEKIDGESVTFWAVTYAETTKVEIDLTAKDGKYKSGETRTSKTFSWQVQQLLFMPGYQYCIKEKDLNAKTMRRAAINLLTDTSLKHFRNQVSQ